MRKKPEENAAEIKPVEEQSCPSHVCRIKGFAGRRPDVLQLRVWSSVVD